MEKAHLLGRMPRDRLDVLRVFHHDGYALKVPIRLYYFPHEISFRLLMQDLLPRLTFPDPYALVSRTAR